jgi:amidase
MVTSQELALMDATAQAELVRRRDIKPIELVDAAIERIERVNPAINAVVTTMYDEARSIAGGLLPDGPFTGVPYLLKDLGDSYAGVRLTSGSALLRDFVPDHDSELVARLKRAGLVVLGKTNTPEFGMLPTTEPRLFGPSRNPWNTEITTGGSSGGAAAAVAAGLVPAAHGGDAAGSIRIPSSCCGVFGLKPTRGRTPAGPDYGDYLGGLAIHHAITRSVRDSAALLDATAGPDAGDPYWAPPPARPFVQEVGSDPGRLRIAFTTEAFTGVPVHDDCVRAVRDAAKLCSDLGHEVEERVPKMDGDAASQAFITVFAGCFAMLMDDAARMAGRAVTSADVEPFSWAMYEMGRQTNAPEYLLAVLALQRIARDVAHFFDHHDLWLTPTLAEPPVPLGTFDSPPESPLLALSRMAQFVPFTPVCNVTGQPGMSVPLYWNDDGLPIGTQFFARFGDEAMLFRLAAQLEAARPWADRIPPVSAIKTG